MPVKTVRPSPSTIRVRKTRARKKIANLRKSEDWYGWALRQFYCGHDIEIAVWVRADEVVESEVTDKDIQLGILFRDKKTFIENLSRSPSIEKATLRVKMEDITLVRPLWLGTEVNPCQHPEI